MLAFSRILAETEVLVVANASTTTSWEGEVIVDRDLTSAALRPTLLYPGAPGIGPPGDVTERADGRIAVQEIDGRIGHGPLHTVAVALAPMEIHIRTSPAG